MTEEQVTKCILTWLENNGWSIISFDFPQSGTGYQIHLNDAFKKTKNKGSFIPDIVASKNNNVVFFENKDRFVLSDFDKIENLKLNNDYSEGISKLLSNLKSPTIYFGIGMPFSIKNSTKSDNYKGKVDFIIFIDEHLKNIVYHQIENIF